LFIVIRETAHSLRYAPFAILGFGHCGFWPFRCPAQGPNWGPTGGGESVAKRTDKIRRSENVPFPSLLN